LSKTAAKKCSIGEDRERQEGQNYMLAGVQPLTITGAKQEGKKAGHTPE
jgi:hypothetical protein